MELSEKLARLANGRTTYTQQLASTNSQTEQLNHDFEIARQRIEITGLTERLSPSLANVRDRLPDLHHYRREVSKREPVLRDIGLARLEISERRRTLSEFEPVFESAMA